MSLSVFYRGSKIRFRFSLTRRRLLSYTGLLSVVLLAAWSPWEYQGIDPQLAQEKITAEQRNLAVQQQVVAEMREKTEKKLGAMTVYLGELRA